MKVLQLHQPYASLIAIEAKRLETRDWPAWQMLLGARVAVHACKTTKELWRTQVEPFYRRLQQARDGGTLLLDTQGGLPLGAIIATAVIDRCDEITPVFAGDLAELNPDEYAFGDYDTSKGPRFAWTITEVERLAVPIPFTGRQGMPDIDPAALAPAAPEAGAAVSGGVQ